MNSLRKPKKEARQNIGIRWEFFDTLAYNFICMKKYALFLFLPFLFNSCRNTSEAERKNVETAHNTFEGIKKLHWLLGTWVNQEGNTYSQETWSQENDSTFTAFSFVEDDKKEIVFAETMALEQKRGNLWLTVAMAKGNGTEPVTFKMVPSAAGQFTFENRGHDFPQRIVYTHPAKDSLHTWIEGAINGQPRRMDFHFSRQ